jgi:hypothetical protein
MGPTLAIIALLAPAQRPTSAPSFHTPRGRQVADEVVLAGLLEDEPCFAGGEGRHGHLVGSALVERFGPGSMDSVYLRRADDPLMLDWVVGEG